MSSVHEAEFDAELPGGASPRAGRSVSGDSAEAEAKGPRRSASEAHEKPSEGDQANVLKLSSEVALLRQAQTGDRAAYGRLVMVCQDRLYNAMFRMTGHADEARDLTQETFTRALDKLATYRGDAAPYTWLFRIATNLAIGQMRRSKRRHTLSIDSAHQRAGPAFGQPKGRGEQEGGAIRDQLAQPPADGMNPPLDALEQRERQQQVLAALERVDPESRALLVMRDVEGFDYQQMAQVLGLPLGTLKSRLFRARLALRDELKAYVQGGKG